MARLGTFTKNNLNKQGFGKLDDESKARYTLALRPMPAVGATLIVIGLAFTLLAGSALSFHYGLPVLGFILGGMVVIGATILTTTLLCLGSWWYRLVFGHAAG